MMTDLTPSEFKLFQSKQTDFMLLDVREPWEYEELNIGGNLIPLSTIPDKLDYLQQWKSKTIVVHCKSGKRSYQAKKYLTKQGFSDVRCITGGIDAYISTTVA